MVQDSGSGEGPSENDTDETRSNNLEILGARRKVQSKGKELNGCSGLAKLLFNFGYTYGPWSGRQFR